MEKKTNRLAGESSPYLLQHAHNPVDWFPWGEEALQKSKNENKPILVSIGYAACHWCHVMERESFEDEATAEVMNANFVNIKIDREERPDLDHIYMEAVQAMTGSGGWPLNVFLTPECKPFYGGTYFPPTEAFNRPSWKNILYSILDAYRERPQEINSQAENLTEHLIKSNSFGQNFQNKESGEAFSKDKLHLVYDNIIKSADKVEGGFGKAPKFPQTFTIHNLLTYFNLFKKEEALTQACLSLDKMIQGGIYDQAGGGFARYSTDRDWLVPHFEKMLYDNALLIFVLSEAWQITHKESYKRTIQQTIDYIQREMLSAENGFYAALDADSEGVEGKYYVWRYEEIQNLLGADAALICEFYDITPGGNWEGTNILHLPVSMEQFAKEKNIAVDDWLNKVQQINKILLEKRYTRIRPQLDDKILLGWNALMNTALSKAYAAIGDENYKELAIKNMNFILSKFRDGATNVFFHTYKNNIAKNPAFLDDYAYLIQALIHLQEISGNMEYLDQAQKLTELVTTNFSEGDSGYFYFTHKDQPDVVIRKKEIYDGAVPAGNSIMAWNLLYLGIIYDREDWKENVVKMLKGLLETTVSYPTSFGVWADILQKVVLGINEIVITGENSHKLLKELLHIFMPHKILQVSAYANEKFPLLKGKIFDEEPYIFLCKNYACQAPVTDINSLILLLEN